MQPEGGVGKTTTTINLGAALAELGRKVLAVDFDPQGALSVGPGINAQELDVTIYNLVVENGHDVRKIIRPTQTANLDVIPATSTCRPPRSSSSVRWLASRCSAASCARS